jgi:2-phosphoglycerate kinase
MRINHQGAEMPYPMATLKGRLRLSGLSDLDTHRTIMEIERHFAASGETPTHQGLAKVCRKLIESSDTTILEDFDTLTQYNTLRKNTDIQPIVVVLQGASSTGKSMLALDLIANLAVTRIISTDTVRQILRVLHTPAQHPELYCHTYQAHVHKQSGPKDLHPMVRGFLAQCELIRPTVMRSVSRVIAEGAEAIVEGVHMVPGDFQDLGTGILEVLVNPPQDVHKKMFVAKHSTSGLKTVSDDIEDREKEFEATRLIQDFMLKRATETAMDTITLVDYGDATNGLRGLVMNHIRRMVETTEDK